MISCTAKVIENTTTRKIPMVALACRLVELFKYIMNQTRLASPNVIKSHMKKSKKNPEISGVTSATIDF